MGTLQRTEGRLYGVSTSQETGTLFVHLFVSLSDFEKVKCNARDDNYFQAPIFHILWFPWSPAILPLAQTKVDKVWKFTVQIVDSSIKLYYFQDCVIKVANSHPPY